MLKSMIRGALPACGRGNSASPLPSGFMRPMRSALLSVNQTRPSNAMAIVVGPLRGCGKERARTGSSGLFVSVSCAPSQR